jgi:hypothetical protein
VNGRSYIAQPSSTRECRESSERAGAGGLHDIFAREIKHPLCDDDTGALGRGRQGQRVTHARDHSHSVPNNLFVYYSAAAAAGSMLPLLPPPFCVHSESSGKE